MGLSCLFGHSWTGCKCTKCGKIRNEEHDWKTDCEKCSVCEKERINLHEWIGCLCIKCKKTRDVGHSWNQDCEKCSICGKIRSNIHNWDGCKCTSCKKTKDGGHDWIGCKCSKCGKTRDEGHEWDGCKCTKCDKSRDEGHDWDGCKCSKCGKSRDLEHKWYGCKCTKCNKIRNEEHDWSKDPTKCWYCGTTRSNVPKQQIVNDIDEISIMIDQFDHNTNSWLFLVYLLMVEEIKANIEGTVFFEDIALRIGLDIEYTTRDWETFLGAMKALAAVDVKAGRYPLPLAFESVMSSTSTRLVHGHDSLKDSIKDFVKSIGGASHYGIAFGIYEYWKTKTPVSN